MSKTVEAHALPVPGRNGSPDFEMYFEIIGYEEIPVANVHANELNPRPTFHLGDDDPFLVKMGDSIASTGQHRPAMVYEQVGHYKHPDQPGHYILLQGERRWRSCRIANVDLLRCQIVRTPKTEAEEYAWLGVEEAFKEDWGLFFTLAYAYNTAKLLGIPMPHKDIQSRTGLEMHQLKLGEKLFKLEAPIIDMVAEYERLLYEAKISGGRQNKGRIGRAAGVRTGEFTVNKAALVYDIFVALRKHLTATVARYDDAELQRRIAQKVAAGATTRHLESLLGQILDAGDRPEIGLVSKVSDLLAHKHKTVRALLRETGNAESGRLERLVKDAERLTGQVNQLEQRPTQLGSNPDRLRDASSTVLRLAGELMQLDRVLRNRAEDLNRGEPQ